MASTAAVSLLFALALSLISLASTTSEYYASARVESCGGCSLHRLPEVKQFINDDVPKYNNVEFKRIPGAFPELVLCDKDGEEMERLPLSKLTREECNNLLVSKGFTKKSKDKDDKNEL